MKLRAGPRSWWPRTRTARGGSVLVIVLWIAFGLVVLALYFGQSMAFELRAMDQRVAGAEAEQAIAGATFYVSNILANVETPGVWTNEVSLAFENVRVGSATMWFIGRDLATRVDEPSFGLVDEASKLNLNTATTAMLELLPRMTPQLAAAIVDWRDTNTDLTTSGAETETYQRLPVPYRCKDAPFESVEELRLVYGMTLEVLFGEDTNRNGVLDPNENDGDVSTPTDNRDGRLDPGLAEYVTVYSREPNLRSDGTARINVASTNLTELRTLLQTTFSTDRANTIMRGLGTNTTNLRSLLEFYLQSGMTADEFAQVESDLTVSSASYQEGLVNVNSASETVLGCLPGIGVENAPSLVAFRKSNPSRLNSMAWVTEVLERTNVISAGPYLTGHSYQFTVDVAAVGHNNRGYRRVQWICDTSSGTPVFLHRQDLTSLGWALGRDTEERMLLAGETR